MKNIYLKFLNKWMTLINLMELGLDTLSSPSSGSSHHLPSSHPHVVLVSGKWVTDVAYCAEVSDGGREGWWVFSFLWSCVRWGQSALDLGWGWIIADPAFVVLSPEKEKEGGKRLRCPWRVWISRTCSDDFLSWVLFWIVHLTVNPVWYLWIFSSLLPID